MSNIVDLTKRRLRNEPVVYTVEIHHTEESLKFVIYDVCDSDEDRLAVARDLERIAMTLREQNGEKNWTKDDE